MGNIVNMTLGIVILFFMRGCCGVIYILNDTEYAKMPPLYALDEYEKCLLEPGGLYCVTDFDLFVVGKSELMDMIHEYSAYTITHYNHTQIHRGICVSQTCKDILEEHNLNGTLDLNMTLEVCLNGTTWSEYGLQARLNKIYYCLEENKNINLDSSDMFIITCYLIIIALNTIGSIYDILYCKGSKGNPYILSFSLRRNWYKLIASPNDGPEPRLRRLKVFHGMKALTMVCVLFSHTMLVISYSYLENPLYIEMSSEDISKQIVLNGSLVTHTFFVISGFLVAYNFKIHTEKHKVSWWHLPKGVLLRWLRLTPTLALMLGTMATVMRHMGKGPLWNLLVTTESEACREYWWSNLLYINNYMYDNKCFLQTWYLACDLQLFILGMMICMIARTPRAQKIAISITSTVAIILVGAHTYFQNLDALLIQTPEKYRHLFTTDDTYNMVYKRGHTNISTYTMGLGAGFLAYYIQVQGKELSNYKRHSWLVTCLAVPLAVAVMLTGGIFYTDKVYPTTIKVMYAMFYRQIFQSIMITIMLVAIFQIENVIRRILEWRGFPWMSRVSYDAFLVHTLLQRGMFGIQMAPVYVTHYSVMVLLSATLFMSFTLGTILWLSVESPVNVLTKMLLEPTRHTKDTKEIPSSNCTLQSNGHV